MSTAIIQDDMYGYLCTDRQGNEVFLPLGNAVYLKAIKYNIDTDEVLYTVKFNYLGETITLDIPRKEMTKKDLLKYAKNGMDVFDHTVGCLIKTITLQENWETVEVFLVHSNLGWGIYNENLIFKSNYIEEIDSDYCGNIKIAPSGTFDEWKAMVEELVIGHTPLEFAVIAGLSAILVGYIGELNNNESLLLAFIGESTTGKTTAAYLAISTAGLPSFSENSLLRTWNATLNAIFKSLVGNFGYPIVLDELSMNKTKDFGGFIYELAAGQEKGRLDKNCNLKDTEGFRTTIITTGEESMLNKSKNNTGISLRLIEFINVQWTESAEQAENIKNQCMKYYGTAALEFSEFLSHRSKDSIIDLFQRKKELYIKHSKVKDSFTNRLSNKYALLMATTTIAKKALGLDFNTKELFKFMLENELENAQHEERNIGARAYDKLMEFITVHIKNFTVTVKSNFGEPEMTPYNTEVWGCILERKEKDAARKVVYIPTDKFNEIMDELGFADSRIILNQFKNKDLLIHDKGRLTIKHTIFFRTPAVRCYAIKMKD